MKKYIVHIKIIQILTVFHLCLVTDINALSIADSLGLYSNTLSISQISGIADSNISGICGSSVPGTLYAVDNESCSIYELSKSGNVLRKIPTSGFIDVEGITHYTGTLFFVAEEQRGNIDRITIPLNGTATISRNSGTVTNIGSGWDNSGIEGICYRSSDSRVFAVKEKDPSRLYTVYLNNEGVPDSSIANSPFNIESQSGDAADLFALPGGDFLILNQEKNLLIGYGPTGKVLSQLSLSTMKQPEGVWVDTTDGSIYVVGEPRQFFVYKRASLFVDSDRRMATLSIESSVIANKKNWNTVELKINSTSDRNILIEFFDLAGRNILSQRKNFLAGKNTISLKLPQCSARFYLCRVSDCYSSTHIKIVL